MTRTESKRWHEYFRNNLKERIYQLTWVLEAPNDKVLANRIGCINRPTRDFILYAVIPTGLRDSLLKRYPNRMVPR